MKFVFLYTIVAVMVAVSCALPTPQEAEILRQDSDVGPESFKYNYATSDGVEAEAEGQLKRIDDEHEAIVVRGAYKFLGDDGETYAISYIADENGFQPQGAHIPVA